MSSNVFSSGSNTSGFGGNAFNAGGNNGSYGAFSNNNQNYDTNGITQQVAVMVQQVVQRTLDNPEFVQHFPNRTYRDSITSVIEGRLESWVVYIVEKVQNSGGVAESHHVSNYIEQLLGEVFEAAMTEQNQTDQRNHQVDRGVDVTSTAGMFDFARIKGDQGILDANRDTVDDRSSESSKFFSNPMRHDIPEKETIHIKTVAADRKPKKMSPDNDTQINTETAVGSFGIFEGSAMMQGGQFVCSHAMNYPGEVRDYLFNLLTFNPLGSYFFSVNYPQKLLPEMSDNCFQ